jgi:hypothetical protein
MELTRLKKKWDARCILPATRSRLRWNRVPNVQVFYYLKKNGVRRRWHCQWQWPAEDSDSDSDGGKGRRREREEEIFEYVPHSLLPPSLTIKGAKLLQATPLDLLPA